MPSSGRGARRSPGVEKRQDDVVRGRQVLGVARRSTSTDPTEVTHWYGVMFLDGAWLIDVAIYTGDSYSLSDEEGQQVIDSLLAYLRDQTP